MHRRGTSSKIVAIATIVVLQLIAIPSLAQPGAALDGMVLKADKATPLAGAKVHLADVRSGNFVESAPTATDGTFHLESLASSEYRIAVEADGGLYVVSTPVTLNEGETRRLHLAVRPDARIDAKSSTGSALSFKENPLTAALLVLGGVGVLAWAIDELDDKNTPLLASPTN